MAFVKFVEAARVVYGRWAWAAIAAILALGIVEAAIILWLFEKAIKDGIL